MNQTKYIITKSQVNAINILLRVVEEAINRNTFDKKEIENINKLSNQLCTYYNVDKQ